MALFLLMGSHEHDGGSDAIDGELIRSIERQPEPQYFVLVDRLFHQVGAAAAPFLGPVQRDVARAVESAMVIEHLVPAPIIAHVEQTRRGASQSFAAASKNLPRVSLQPGAQLGAKTFLRRRVTEIHLLLRSRWIARSITPPDWRTKPARAQSRPMDLVSRSGSYIISG